MADSPTYVIVGAGQAGGWAARTLRDEGFEGAIVLIGEESHPPYERPPLSKEVLLGDADPDSTYLWPRDSWDELGVTLRLGVCVESLSPDDHTVTLASGETMAWDRLMLATGGRPRPLDIPGADLDGIHYLRSIADTEAIRAGLVSGSRIVVIGGGWIGLEVAAAARKAGADATVIEVQDRLCARVLEPGVAGHLQSLHESHGVDIRLGTGIERFEGNGSVTAAVLSGGERIDCAMAVIGIGLIANTELAAAAGLEVNNGIVVDEHGRTSHPDIFAAGDVTCHPNGLLGRRVRLESWENAQNQGIAAGRAMLGKGDPYNEVPWFWSDQYDVNIQLIGLPSGWDISVMRGDPATGSFVEFYLKDGRIEGGVAFNNGRDLRFAKRLMQSGKVLDPAQLADTGVKMQALLKG